MYITHQKCQQKKRKDKGNVYDAIPIKTPQPYLSIKCLGISAMHHVLVSLKIIMCRSPNPTLLK